MRVRLALTLDIDRRRRDDDQPTERETQLDALVERGDPAERPAFGFQPRVTEEGRA